MLVWYKGKEDAVVPREEHRWVDSVISKGYQIAFFKYEEVVAGWEGKLTSELWMEMDAGREGRTYSGGIRGTRNRIVGAAQRENKKKIHYKYM